jgi:hypothetical protein
MAMRTEIKLFLTAFLIYCVFLRWSGMTGNSILALARSVSEENTFVIDSYANATSDRTLFEGNYYSDKEPGLSLISLPAYAFSRILTMNAPLEAGNSTYKPVLEINGLQIWQTVPATNQFLLLLIIITLLSSTLPNSLTTVLVYKAGKMFFGETESIVTALIYSFGSLAFHYSITFLPYGVSTFLSFLSFYVLVKSKNMKSHDLHAILSGVISGLACTISLFAIPIAGLISLYLFTKSRRGFVLFALGAMLGMAPILVYNFAIFGTPLDLPRFHMDPVIWPNLQGNAGLSVGFDSLFIAYRLLLDPYKGLLYYYPIYIVSIIGAFYMLKSKHRTEALLALSIFFIVLAMAASWWGWWHGGFFGPRFLLFSTPFIVLPIGFVFKSLGKSTVPMLVVAALLALSIISNIVGLTLFYEDMLKDLSNSSEMKAEFSSYVYSLRPFPDVRVNYYLPEFLKYGPRSRLAENVMSGEFPDIREFTYVDSRIPFLNLSFFILAGIFWIRELYRRKRRL